MFFKDCSYSGCHKRGGVITGGVCVYKRKRTQTNVHKRRCQALWKGTRHADRRAQMRANANRREQTQNQGIAPPLPTPSCSPSYSFQGSLKLISLQLQLPCFKQRWNYKKRFLLGISKSLAITVAGFNCLRISNVMILKRDYVFFVPPWFCPKNSHIFGRKISAKIG